MEVSSELKMPIYAEKFLNRLIDINRTDSTVKRYSYDLFDFFRWLNKTKGNVDFETWVRLTDSDYKEFFYMLIQTRNYSERTLKRVNTVLRRLSKHYLNEGYLVVKPTLDVDFLSDDDMKAEDFITASEYEKLLNVIPSPVDLSEHQMEARMKLAPRNVSIVTMLTKEGLSLQELVSLQMDGMNFSQNTITLITEKGTRTIKIADGTKHVNFEYYKSIPHPVRPRDFSPHPFYVSFDFNRNTFRWVYKSQQPKKLTEVMIQKMIRSEVTRAQIRRGISAQQLRNTAILNSIINKMEVKEIKQKFNLKTDDYLKRFYRFANTNDTSIYHLR